MFGKPKPRDAPVYVLRVPKLEKGEKAVIVLKDAGEIDLARFREKWDEVVKRSASNAIFVNRDVDIKIVPEGTKAA